MRPITYISTLFVFFRSFLVGAFSLKEKSPTITVRSFFSAYNLTLNGPLFLQSYLTILSKFVNNGAKPYKVG